MLKQKFRMTSWLKRAPISPVQTLALLNVHSCVLCCSAVVLGAGKLGLEPVLCGEEAVARQHRDQPHDL